MALPATGPISMAMVAEELGIPAAGLSLNDSRVRALAGKSSGPISLSDLRGKIHTATMVAGSGYSNGRNTRGFAASGSTSGLTVGSLTALPWQPATCVFFGSYDDRGPHIEFPGNVVSALTGKSVEVNGVVYPMPAASYFASKTIWTRNSGTNWIPVEGQSYRVRII